jgi:hypothetical protein
MIKVQNWVTEDEIVTVLNAEPPRATLYARFVEAYWKGSALDEPPETAEQLSATLREWAERETRIGRAAFVANYLALAPTFTPRAATPQESWQLPDTIPRKQSRSIGAALVSAHLRTLVDEWLETARDPDGSEWPSRRDLRKALRGWEVASEFLADSPPSMYPASEGGGFGLTIAEPHWGRPWAGDFFAAQEVTAGRLFVGVLASDWQPRLCKCRYSPCGKYFVGAKIRKGYRHGTFCSREHRAHASADAVTKARRRHSRLDLIEAAARWLARRHADSAWQDNHELKASLAAVLCKQISLNPNLRAGCQSVGAKWVTRNRTAIEGRRIQLT